MKKKIEKIQHFFEKYKKFDNLSKTLEKVSFYKKTTLIKCNQIVKKPIL